MSRPPHDPSSEGGLDSVDYRLVLFVAGASVLSTNAIGRIRDVCERELAGRVELEVVDVHQEPDRVRQDDIVAVPTLLKKLPSPLRRLVGDLSTQRILVALDLRPRPDLD
jgi:circadian clock protein KaiB